MPPASTKILVIGGDTMVAPTPEELAASPTGYSNYWQMAKMLSDAGYPVAMRECVETGKRSKVTLQDVKEADIIICYSYGGASVWEIKEGEDIGCKKGIIMIATVGDRLKGQIKEFGLWHVPENFAYGFCFDVGDSPTSSTIKNAGTVDVEIGQGWSTALRFVNIHCDRLYPPIMWPGQKHIKIKEHPAVLQMVVDAAGFMAQVARAS